MKISLLASVIIGIGLLSVAGVTVPASQAGTPGDVILVKFVGGTIEEVDPAGMQITIQNQTGKKESLPVARKEVIQGLSKGDLVSLELDEQGKVLSVVKSDLPPSQPVPVPEPKS